MCITSVENPREEVAGRSSASLYLRTLWCVVSRHWRRPTRQARAAPQQLVQGVDRRRSFIRPSPLGELPDDARRPADWLSRDGRPPQHGDGGVLMRWFLPRRRTRKLCSPGPPARAATSACSGPPVPTRWLLGCPSATPSSWHWPRRQQTLTMPYSLGAAPGILREGTSNPPTVRENGWTVILDRGAD